MNFEFDIGVVSGSFYDADGFIGFQVNVFGDASAGAGCPEGELQTPFGFDCRPVDPLNDPNGVPLPSAACQALFCWDGSRLHGFPTQDPRFVPLLPQLTQGSGRIYNCKGSYVVADGETGDILVAHVSGTLFRISDDGVHASSPGLTSSFSMTDEGFDFKAPLATFDCEMTKFNGIVTGVGGTPLMTAALVPSAAFLGG